MALRITDVEPLEGYRLRLTFNDGLVREIDASFLLHRLLGEELKDPGYFRRVRVDPAARTIVWPNGLDPDPDLLHGDFEPASPAPNDNSGAGSTVS